MTSWGQVSSVSNTRERAFPVIEVFGPTVQGEGAMIGQLTHFVRFGGCDYRCAWCDTLYAVLPEEVRANARHLTVEEIVNELLKLEGVAQWVTFSGGNPLLLDLEPLVMRLRRLGYKIAVETQGTIFRLWVNGCDHVTISPKPPSSGMKTDWQLLARFITFTAAPKSLKVVVFDEEDLDYAARVHTMWPDVPFYLQVGNRVGQDTRDDLLKKLEWLLEQAKKVPAFRDARILPQLHVLIYGNKRGV